MYLDRFFRGFILFIIFSLIFATIPFLGGEATTATAAPSGNTKREAIFQANYYEPPDEGIIFESQSQPSGWTNAIRWTSPISEKTLKVLMSTDGCNYPKIEKVVCNSLSVDKYFADSCGEETDVSDISTMPIPSIKIKYDRHGNYDPHGSWGGVDPVDLLARAMLAEENSKLCDPEKDQDFLGSGWVIVNRTKINDGYFDYADGSIEKAVLSFQQFALTGTKHCQRCPLLPGNAAIVANPESYNGWFGGNPRASYWKSYSIAMGIIHGELSDPTFGALFFSDAHYDDSGGIVFNQDGRTRFKYYIDGSNYTIDELEKMSIPPWP